MNALTIYGGGGVESRHAPQGSGNASPSQGWCQNGFESRQTGAACVVSRSSALPASTLCAECSTYGEYESPSWFLRIGTAVVVISLAWCAAKFLGVV